MQFDATDNPGEVKGFTNQFQQMWNSACHAGSQMTCVMCHNPHRSVEPAEAAGYFRDRCLQCHDDGATSHDCGLTSNVRGQRNDNDCVACHMPRGNSEIPHAPTTNHRVAVYPLVEDGDSGQSIAHPHEPTWQSRVGDLVIDQITPTPHGIEAAVLERVRTEAVAMALLQHYQRADVDAAADRGPSDGWDDLLRRLDRLAGDEPGDDVAGGLTAQSPPDVRWGALATTLRVLRANSLADRADRAGGEAVDWQAVLVDAKSQLRRTPRGSTLRNAALQSLVSAGFETGRFDVVAAAARELTDVRRNAADWYHLGLAYGRLKQPAAAGQCLTEAMRIEGTYSRAYRSMGRLLQPTDPAMADQVNDVAAVLESRPAVALKPAPR